MQSYDNENIFTKRGSVSESIDKMLSSYVPSFPALKGEYWKLQDQIQFFKCSESNHILLASYLDYELSVMGFFTKEIYLSFLIHRFYYYYLLNNLIHGHFSISIYKTVIWISLLWIFWISFPYSPGLTLLVLEFSDLFLSGLLLIFAVN